MEFKVTVPANEYKAQLRPWVAGSFTANDYFVTLTYREYIDYDEVKCSQDVRMYMRKLNKFTFGRAFSNNKIGLRCFSVFEFTKAGTPHIHMLLGNPYSTRNRAFEVEAINSWQTMQRSGLKAGQNIQYIENEENVLNYVTKYTSGNNHQYVDFNNVQLRH